MEELANRLAEYAYYCLVASVALLLATTIVEERKLEPPKTLVTFTRRASNLARWFTSKTAHLLNQVTPWDKIEVVLVVLSYVSALLLVAKSVEPIAIPGRPTMLYPLPLPRGLLEALSALGIPALWTKLGPLVGLLGLALIVLDALTASGPLASLFLLLLYTVLILARNLTGYVVLAITALTLLTLLPYSYAIIGWSLLVSSTLLGILTGLLAVVQLAYRRIAGNEVVEKLEEPLLPSRSLRASLKDKWVLVSAAAGLALALTLETILHAIHGWRVLSLDTVFNLRMCKQAVHNPTLHLSWQRPLYSILACGIGSLVNWNPMFYDYAIPVIGFTLLSIAIAVAAKYLGVSGWKLPAIAVGSLAYWLPFFIYAGFQTNLLALSIAYPLAAITVAHLVSRKTSKRLTTYTAVLSTLLGLWHPWTLAYTTIAVLLAAVLTGDDPRTASIKLLGLLPGWLAHAAIAITAGSSAVVSVAVSAFTTIKPLVWNLKIYVWGTGLRGEHLLPLGLLLLAKTAKTRIPGRELWLIAMTAPIYPAMFLPLSELYIRLLVEAPLPLLLLYYLAKITDKWGTLQLVAAALASFVTCLSILRNISPIPVPA
jgi:hypothetical protein